MTIEESYRNNILKKLENFLYKTREEYYKHPTKEVKYILDKVENEFIWYCEKYISIIEKEVKK